MALSKSTMTRVDGTSHLRINKNVDSTQLLVTLSRNDKEWLSPVGWVNKEKGTLLDCQSGKDHTIVEIPAEFAKNLKDDDEIKLHSREIDFDASMTWGHLAASAAKTVKKPNGAAPMETLSLEESEKRAKDAEKAAAEYRVQMEAASKAREAAQAAALVAARKADEALKAEADRIAEMERAAKAFEDAERKRMDEQRRLDRERRLEEERKIEAARQAEEARLKAEADRLKKERGEARKFFKGQISETKAEKTRLQDVLAGFKAKAESSETEMENNEKRLTRMEKTLASTQKDEADSKAALAREETRIVELKSAKNKIQSSISNLEKDNEKLFKSLEKAESVHEKALKEVEAAKIRAAEALKGLSTVKAQTDKVKAQRDSFLRDREDAGNKLSAHENHLSDLKSTYEKARLAAETEQSNLKTLRKSKDDLAQKLNGAKTDVARTLQDIRSTDDTLKRQQTSLKQVEDMENADDIRQMTGGSGGNGKAPPRKRTEPAKSALATQAAKAAKGTEEKGGFLSRFFSKSGQDENVRAGAIQKDAKKPVGKKPAEKPNPKSASKKTEAPAKPTKLAANPVAQRKTASQLPETNTPKPTTFRENGRGKSGYRLNSWLLMGIAVTGIAALGTAYALNNSGGDKAITAKAKINPAPQSTTKTAADTHSQAPILLAEASGTDLVKTTNSSQLDPEMTPVALGEDVSKSELPAQVAKSAKPPKSEVTPKPAQIKSRSSNTNNRANRRAATSTASSPARDYTIVTRQVQEQLSYLGFYNGEIDGQQTTQTQEAMRDFKSVYDLPANNNFTGGFLNTLKRAYEEQVDLRSVQAVTPQNDTVIQVAENTNSVPVFQVSSLPAVTTVETSAPASVETEVLGAAFEQSQTSAPIQSVTPTTITEATVAAPKQVAELTLPTTSIAQSPDEDVIVPAKVIRKARVEYPSRLQRQKKYYNAKVYVSYDVGLDGKIADPIVQSVEFEGTEFEREQFEKAAIKAVSSQRFTPRTENGDAIIEESRTTRIVFNAE